MSTPNRDIESFNRLRHVGIHMSRRWSDSELSELERKYPKVPNGVLARQLDRTVSSIKTMASNKGLYKNRKSVITWKIENSKHEYPKCDEFGHYVRGFTDGEGSFNYSKRDNGSIEFKYAIELVQSDEEIVYKIKNFFNVGNMNYQDKRKEEWSDTIQYAVSSAVELGTVIIPFFVNNPPIADNKLAQFIDFAESFAEYFNLEPETVKWVDRLQSIVVEN